MAAKSGESICFQRLPKILTEASPLSLITLSIGSKIEEWYAHDIPREKERE